MSGVNKVLLLGDVEDDPVSQTMPDGTKVLSFTLLTVEEYSKGSRMQEHIERHQIVVNPIRLRIAILAIVKGVTLYLQGKAVTRCFTDETGKKRYATEIIAENLEQFNGRYTLDKS